MDSYHPPIQQQQFMPNNNGPMMQTPYTQYQPGMMDREMPPRRNDFPERDRKPSMCFSLLLLLTLLLTLF